MALSVLSRDCSPDTVERRIDSGVSEASRSSTFAVALVDSREDWTSSAFACASVTFCSASSMNLLKTSWTGKRQRKCLVHVMILSCSYLDRADVCVLSCVLVLVEAIFGEFASPQVDAELDKEYHHRLEGGNRAVSRSLGDDMFVEERQRGLLLIDSDELLCSL